MANSFLSETDTAVGTSPASIYTCPASTETTIIGLSISNIVTSQILIDVVLDASARTSGAEDSVYLNQGSAYSGWLVYCCGWW
jgi:hypothetical protein